jgi:hypothetical protein
MTADKEPIEYIRKINDKLSKLREHSQKLHKKRADFVTALQSVCEHTDVIETSWVHSYEDGLYKSRRKCQYCALTELSREYDTVTEPSKGFKQLLGIKARNYVSSEEFYNHKATVEL